MRWEAATLCAMDSVRFGRALGIGARLAAKTVASAVDAATAPNPSREGEAGSGCSCGETSAEPAARLGDAGTRADEPRCSRRGRD